jgi:hypothetical protein
MHDISQVFIGEMGITCHAQRDLDAARHKRCDD